VAVHLAVLVHHFDLGRPARRKLHSVVILALRVMQKVFAAPYLAHQRRDVDVHKVFLAGKLGGHLQRVHQVRDKCRNAILASIVHGGVVLVHLVNKRVVRF